jgi:hypothetical protein
MMMGMPLVPPHAHPKPEIATVLSGTPILLETNAKAVRLYNKVASRSGHVVSGGWSIE